jgi:4-amino-4-deoxy-L-arabinose transferase-like glycosyltransferase
VSKSKSNLKAEPPAAQPAGPEAPAPRASEGAADEGPAPWLTALRARLPTDRQAVWAVLILGALIFLPFLGTLGLWDPWEPHYGEVARAMIVRDDYVYPYWESSYFFSKPALPIWMMALGMLAVGAEGAPAGEPLGAWTEWGIRLPFAMVAVLCLWAVYRLATQLKDRSAGVIAALVLGTSAQFIFIGKQAMVDMPLVGFLTAGLALFCRAVFDEDEDRPGTGAERGVAAGGIALALFPQLIAIGRELHDAAQIAPVLGAALLGVAFVAAVVLKATKRQCYLAGFYVMVALSALSKGLAPLAILGPAVVLYILLSRDWRVLLRAQVPLGGVLFLLVASPWYVTLSLFDGRDDEGKTFFERFWLHDNFGRVGAGVHGDRGGLGYFLEQLAYGMFPWVALVPHALGFAARRPPAGEEGPDARRRMLLFVLVYAAWAYVFFTLGQTKFHHYIFPAVPALAVLVALWVTWLAERPSERLSGYLGVLVAMVFAVAARDLINDPQNLVNLFTYKYDRDYPREVDPRPYMIAMVAAGGAAMVFFYLRQEKARVILAFLATGAVFGTWISHHHFNMLTPHWSQAHLFKTYYAEKKGDEPIYAYQLNWRGETFYSRNSILQVKENGANERIRALVDRPGREFIITEQSRFHTLKGVLSPDKREKLEILDQSSNKFYLCVVED